MKLLIMQTLSTFSLLHPGFSKSTLFPV